MNNTYLTYTPQDLATDDQFILWVQEGRPSDTPWATWIENHPEVVSKIDEAVKIVTIFRYSERTIPQSKTDAIWGRINTTIAEKETKVVNMPRRNVLRLISYAAAACAVLFFASRLLLDNSSDIYVGPSEQVAHVLPDASKIQINADSRISYNKDNWTSERALSLNGEAYFEVEKGQKFVVHTDNGDVTVLGTSFNIYSREDGFRVHCTSGKVQVTSGNEEVILTPDTRASLQKGDLIREDLEKGKSVDWLNKIYRFDAIPLRVVFESIERQFNVEITIDEVLSNRLYTGSFEATDLNKALQAICFPMELSPNITGNKISIKLDAAN